MFVSKQDRAVNLILIGCNIYLRSSKELTWIMGIYEIKPNALKYYRVANHELEFSVYLRASNSLPIGLKTISHCQNSHLRIIVNQSL